MESSGCGSERNSWGYAGVGSCFYLPGSHFGQRFLSRSQVDPAISLTCTARLKARQLCHAAKSQPQPPRPELVKFWTKSTLNRGLQRSLVPLFFALLGLQFLVGVWPKPVPPLCLDYNPFLEEKRKPGLLQKVRRLPSGEKVSLELSPFN